MKTSVETRDALALIAGPTVWAIGFSALYGIQGAGCQLGWAEPSIGSLDLLRALLLLVWAAHLLVLARTARWIFRRAYAPPDRSFLRFAASALAVTGLVAMLWTGLPIVFTSMCTT